MVRFIHHLVKGTCSMGRLISEKEISDLEHEITEHEKNMSAEIAFAIEEKFSLSKLFNKLTPKQRALDLFSIMRVWDTEENNGVLIYLLLAEKDVEIIADRGVLKFISQDQIEKVCKSMEAEIRQNGVHSGISKGIRIIAELLKQHFPRVPQKINQVQNKFIC